MPVPKTVAYNNIRINEDEEFEKLTQQLGRDSGENDLRDRVDILSEEVPQTQDISLKDELSQLVDIEGQLDAQNQGHITTALNTAQTSPAPKVFQS